MYNIIIISLGGNILNNISTVFRERGEYTGGLDLNRRFDDVIAFHKSIDCYEITPMRRLKCLAASLGVKEIYVKDESYRFGLNAFKGLGVSYALDRILKDKPAGETLHFVSCTDGNHGRALAWRAGSLGHKTTFFMPKGAEERRIKAIEAFGAEVITTEYNYDDTVRLAKKFADENGAYLVQDTALPGYEDVPTDIVYGYTTMAAEALDQIDEKPTHVFLQAGVGSMAGGAVMYLCSIYGGDLPHIGTLEADSCACIYESARQGRPVAIGGITETAMAGLNCGEANPITLPLLLAKCSSFSKCSDDVTFLGMEMAVNPVGTDEKFSSGESGAVGLGFIKLILTDPKYAEYKEKIGLDENSVVLLFSTEGVLEG